MSDIPVITEVPVQDQVLLKFTFNGRHVLLVVPKHQVLHWMRLSVKEAGALLQKYAEARPNFWYGPTGKAEQLKMACIMRDYPVQGYWKQISSSSSLPPVAAILIIDVAEVTRG